MHELEHLSEQTDMNSWVSQATNKAKISIKQLPQEKHCNNLAYYKM